LFLFNKCWILSKFILSFIARNLLEVLPKVPVSRPATLTDAEEKTLWQEEESVLRELRLFLRDMLNKLARDKKFNIFSKPVDIEEVGKSTPVHSQIFLQ